MRQPGVSPKCSSFNHPLRRWNGRGYSAHPAHAHVRSRGKTVVRRLACWLCLALVCLSWSVPEVQARHRKQAGRKATFSIIRPPAWLDSVAPKRNFSALPSRERGEPRRLPHDGSPAREMAPQSSRKTPTGVVQGARPAGSLPTKDKEMNEEIPTRRKPLGW